MIVKVDNEKNIVRIYKNNKDTYEYFVKDAETGKYEIAGGYKPNITEEKIIFSKESEEKLGDRVAEQIKDQINALSDEVLEEEAERNEKIKEIAEKDGLELEDFAFIDLEEEIEEDNEIDKIDKEEDEDEQEIEDEEEQEVDEKESKQTTIKDVNVKQEIDISERANDMKNLRQWLGNTIPQEYTKMVVVKESDTRNIRDENGQNYKVSSDSFFNLALVDKKGNVVPIEKYVNMTQSRSEGEHPDQQSDSVDVKGKVEKDAATNVFEFKDDRGRRKVIEVNIGEYGYIDVNVGEKERGSNEYLTAQMETDQTEIRHIKELSVMEEYDDDGMDRVNDSLNELNYERKIHGKYDKEGKEVEYVTEQADGDENTKESGHGNIQLSKEFIEKATKVMLEDDEITANVYNFQEVMEKTIEKLEKNGYEINKVYDDKDTENIKKIMKETNQEIEKEAEGQKVLGQNDSDTD